MSEVKLPEPAFKTFMLTDDGIGGYFTAEQMEEYAEQRVREVLVEIKELIKAIPDDELSKFDETPDFWTGALESKCRSILIIINRLEANTKDKP